MSFKDIALPLIARGIPVIPVQPGQKKCLLPNWPGHATTGKAMVEFWDQENPNYNVGCVGKLDGFVILDCDRKGLPKEIEAETGQKFEPTFTVRSAGKRCLHIYYRHTTRSRALGNRAVGDMFDLQADDKYVVGPGSVLIEEGKPNRSYGIIHDYPIADFPDWLADWVEKHSDKPKKFEGELSPVCDDFDIDEMLEHYGLTYVQQGHWYNCYQECPVAGYQHQHSKMPGFFFDGNELGFNCWASGCPSKGWNAGKVIKHLNETHEPYPKLIWPERELDYAALGIEEADLPAPDAVEVEEDDVTPAVDLSNMVVKVVTDPVWRPKHEVKPVQVGEITILETPTVVTKHKLQDMPSECMYGWLGKKTLELGVPIGFGYPAMLAMSAARIQVHPEHVRPTIYVGLIGPVGWGKSQAYSRAKDAFVWANAELIQESLPYSDRGLAKLFKNTSAYSTAGPSTWKTAETRLLAVDELRALMGKINVPNATLGIVLNTLWNFDRAGGADKKSKDEVFCRLNILGNLAAKNTEEFTEQFGKETSTGLYDRFVYGLAPKLEWSVPSIKAEDRNPVPVSVPAYCYEMKRDWVKSIEGRNDRLGEIALRVAVITSGINHEGTVLRECMTAALEFMEWQEAIRLRYKPSEALGNTESQCTEAILNAFRYAMDKDGKPVWKNWRQMYKNRNWFKYGASMVNRVKKAMVDSGELTEEQNEILDENSEHYNPPKFKRTGRMCYSG